MCTLSKRKDKVAWRHERTCVCYAVSLWTFHFKTMAASSLDVRRWHRFVINVTEPLRSRLHTSWHVDCRRLPMDSFCRNIFSCNHGSAHTETRKIAIFQHWYLLCTPERLARSCHLCIPYLPVCESERCKALRCVTGTRDPRLLFPKRVGLCCSRLTNHHHQLFLLKFLILLYIPQHGAPWRCSPTGQWFLRRCDWRK